MFYFSRRYISVLEKSTSYQCKHDFQRGIKKKQTVDCYEEVPSDLLCIAVCIYLFSAFFRFVFRILNANILKRLPGSMSSKILKSAEWVLNQKEMKEIEEINNCNYDTEYQFR